MRISDWSSDVCSSDLERLEGDEGEGVLDAGEGLNLLVHEVADVGAVPEVALDQQVVLPRRGVDFRNLLDILHQRIGHGVGPAEVALDHDEDGLHGTLRSEEHTSELQSLMRISYAVFCLKKKTK